MAYTQTAAYGDMKGMAPSCHKDDDDYYYTQFGPARIFFGSGSPNALITIPIYSMGIAFDTATGQMYTCYGLAAASSSWTAIKSV
uniref:Uncharacterized protein n=1 Tax=viral metagenome TaxID=1070528 RepID=A0A6M3KV23_9ZZZZ